MEIIYYLILHCFFYLSTWKAIDYKITLSKFNYLDGYKRKYVIKNLVKCFCLFIWTPFALLIIKDAFLFNKWDNQKLHVLGSFYTLNDFLGLILVNGLPVATKIHHSCVIILGINNYFTDYSIPSVWRATIIYGAFSTLAFSVNGYMGLRYLTDNNNISSKKKLKNIALISLLVYLTCFTLNWLYHYYLLINLKKTFSLFIYYTLAHLVMFDDIKLIKHLYKVSFYIN